MKDLTLDAITKLIRETAPTAPEISDLILSQSIYEVIRTDHRNLSDESLAILVGICASFVRKANNQTAGQTLN